MVLKKGRRGERLSDYECRSEAPVYVSARPPRTWKPRTSTRTHQRYCRRLSVAVKNMPRRTAYRACLRDPDTHFGVLLVPAKPTSGAHH
jgi:hypothetical protein